MHLMRRQNRAPSPNRLVAIGFVMVLTAAGCARKAETDAAQETLARGLEAHRDGRTTEAVEAYREVLRLEPKNKFAYFNLGVIEQAANRPAGAEALYRLALTLDGNFVPALLNLAIVRTNADDAKGAEELYLRLIELEPGNGQFHMDLGFLLLDEGEEDRGDREIRTALKLDPSLRRRIPENGERDGR